MLLLASSGCASLPSFSQLGTCYGTLHRDTLVAGAAALSAATGGETPTLREADCDGWSAEVITYPGIARDVVAARITRLTYCIAHIDAKNTRTWWECSYSGSVLTVTLDSDQTPVRVWVGAH